MPTVNSPYMSIYLSLYCKLRQFKYRRGTRLRRHKYCFQTLSIHDIIEYLSLALLEYFLMKEDLLRINILSFYSFLLSVHLLEIYFYLTLIQFLLRMRTDAMSVCSNS